jgi:hypothetical protein
MARYKYLSKSPRNRLGIRNGIVAGDTRTLEDFASSASASASA